MASPFDMDMSADPLEFDEAVAEFSSRRVISRQEADTIAEYARRRAWWITGVAQMDVVNDAHDALLDGIRNGKTFDDWKNEIGPKLEKAWGRKDSARLLLIYRNATSSAYNAGRHAQMDEPEIRDIRPYRKLSPVADLRTSEICEKFISPPVILPIDDPRWLRLHPPFHHGCRTGIVTLRKSVAEKAGITTELPDFELDDGWGYPPEQTEPPKPGDRDVPPPQEIHQEFTKKAIADLVKRKPVKIPVKQEHTPEYWTERYREKYGEAAAAVGYGRAIHERAKETPWKKLLKEAKVLDDTDVPGMAQFSPAIFKCAKYGEENVDSVTREKAEQGRALLMHRRLLGAKRDKLERISTPFPDANRCHGKAAKWFEEFSSPQMTIPKPKWLIYDIEGHRASMEPAALVGRMGSHDAPHVWVHEWGHAIEIHARQVSQVKAFRASREAGEKLESLADVLGDPGYRADEVTRKDKYYHAYMGKVYGESDYSEVVSVLFGDLAAGKDILSKDPESFYFALGLLRGY